MNLVTSSIFILFKLPVVISILSCFLTFQFASLITTLHPSHVLQADTTCFPKTVLILQPQADHHLIFLLPDLIPHKAAFDYFQMVFSLAIFPSLIPSNFCCNSSNPLFQFFNNNVQYFYFNAIFSF